MTTIERLARPEVTRPEVARREQARAAQVRLSWGARWLSSFRGEFGRGELGHDSPSSVRPEDVARSELFYSSTCCWV